MKSQEFLISDKAKFIVRLPKRGTGKAKAQQATATAAARKSIGQLDGWMKTKKPSSTTRKATKMKKVTKKKQASKKTAASKNTTATAKRSQTKVKAKTKKFNQPPSDSKAGKTAEIIEVDDDSSLDRSILEVMPARKASLRPKPKVVPTYAAADTLWDDDSENEFA